LLFDASWPAPPGVRAVCSTREGGVSHAPYDSLNLGDHVGDDAQAVAANRERFAGALGARPVFLNQVHGIELVELGADTPDATEADACFTTRKKLACTIMVADCLPVLFCNAAAARVGAAHAGWRGLAGGVLEAALGGFEPATTLAWLGPCIGPTAFEVGPEVKAAFESHDSGAAQMFKPHKEGKWLADLPGLARLRLRAIGISQVYGNDGGAAWCTVSNPSRFFSHRRDRVSGRMAASIWLE
jgi:YfiH family protein